MKRALLHARKVLLVAAAAAMIALPAALPGAASADPFDPLFTFYASVAREPPPPPHSYPDHGAGFDAPCGVAVDPNGSFYVADYGHDAVDVFDSARRFLTELDGVDPEDGPCELAVDQATGALYVNDFHRRVVRYAPSAYPVTAATTYGSATVIDEATPTGVAVDPVGGRVYVDNRTHVSVYEPSGEPVMEGGEPLRIGEGSLADAYGVAVSDFAATQGWVYVADAGDRRIEAFDPAVSTTVPVQTIDGSQLPAADFVSLVDAALALDQSSGNLYVSDDLQPAFFERPEAAIYAFKPNGGYAGRLKFNVVDARPPGLAVGHGLAFVTSGNAADAFVYIYTAGSLTAGTGACAVGGLCPGADADAPAPAIQAGLGPPPPAAIASLPATEAAPSSPVGTPAAARRCRRIVRKQRPLAAHPRRCSRKRGAAR